MINKKTISYIVQYLACIVLLNLSVELGRSYGFFLGIVLSTLTIIYATILLFRIIDEIIKEE
jgi:hypothetical protein